MAKVKTVKPTEQLSFISRTCRFFAGSSGQSSVEYIIVTSVLIAALITLPNAYDTISHTMQDKYKSYMFSVAISDPPSKKFDDMVAQKIDIIAEIKDLTFGKIIPDIMNGKFNFGDFKNFFNLVKSLL